MRTLHVVSVATDGSHAILGDDSGEQFSLPLDARLRSSVSTAGPAAGATVPTRAAASPAPSPGSVTSPDPGDDGPRRPLGPREIQTRVRAGESPAEISRQSGMPDDRVRRFAAPVLDERAHVATRAQRALVRDEGMLELGTLAEVVARALDAAGVAGAARWDAWRRDDGRWVTTTTWGHDGHVAQAQWLLDQAMSSAAPMDAIARALTGEPDPEPVPTRLAVVPDPSSPDAADDTGPVSAVAAAAPSDPGRQPSLDDAIDADETPTGPVPTVSDATSAPGPAHPAHRGVRARQHEIAADDDGMLRLADIADVIEEDETPRRRSHPRGAARERPAVPSWDEIMFGRRS